MHKKLLNISILTGIITIIAFYSYVLFFPMNTNTKIIEVENGDRLGTISEKLYKNKIINSQFLFKIYMYLTWNQNNLKTGEYSIPNGASLSEIKNTITSGRMYNKYLTIPEGLTIKQIFEIIDSYKDINGTITEPVNEGELLPQTYAYNKSISKNDLIIKIKQLRIYGITIN
jgi:UPF0755 protein